MIASRTEVRDTPSKPAQLAFRRKTGPGGEFAVVDQRDDLSGDLPIQPRRLHRAQWHLGVPLAIPAAATSGRRRRGGTAPAARLYCLR